MGGGGRWRWVLAALVSVVWLGITLPGAVVAVAELEFGDIGCPAPGSDSNYGHKEWSVVPPGPRCVWTRELNGFAAEDDPSKLWTFWLVAVVASGLVALPVVVTLTTAAARGPVPFHRGPR